MLRIIARQNGVENQREEQRLHPPQLIALHHGHMGRSLRTAVICYAVTLMLKAGAEETRSALPQLGGVDSWRPADLVCVLALCIVLAGLRWARLDSLVSADPAMWLHQAWRASLGELPYRDFSWNYPPLAVFAFGWAFRLFGATFDVAQALTDVLSVAIVLAGYALLCRLAPRYVQLAGMFLLIAICATTLTKFNLFSFATYSHALTLGAAGVLAVTVAAVDCQRTGRLGPARATVIAAGGMVAALSKPEAWAAALAVISVLALADRSRLRGRDWVRRHAGLVLATNVPALIAYGVMAGAAGTDNLRAGLAGYGLSGFACPWWPTGLGVFGAVTAITEAAALATLISLAWRERFRAWLGRRYRLLLAAGAVGLVSFAAYHWMFIRRIIHGSQPLANKLQQIAPLVSGTSPALLPVMWVAVLWCAVLAWRLLRGRISQRQTVDLIVLCGPAVMSVRGLFGTTLFPFTEVPAICYPFFALLAPWMLWRWLEAANSAPGGARRVPAAAITAILALAYGSFRLAGAWPTGLSPRTGRVLETAAGRVRLGHASEALIYSYVVSHTGPADAVLDLPYGGGINFAARRRSPLFVTQHSGLFMPPQYQQLDLKRFLADPPKIVIADHGPSYGTYWGVEGTMRCACPRLVWRPDQPSTDPTIVFPVVEHIRRNYHVEREFGRKLILVPNTARKS